MIFKYRLILSFVLLILTTHSVSAESGIVGIWKTESTDKGYLHVQVENCGDLVCGTILQAMNLENEERPDYEHLGKNMIWDMASSGSLSWSGGKIWDPSKDKTYKSKMKLDKDVLKVSGCIAFICRSQSWKRVVE